jgi:hypothetical protein
LKAVLSQNLFTNQPQAKFAFALRKLTPTANRENLHLRPKYGTRRC